MVAAATTFLTGVSLLAGAGLLSNANTLAAIAPRTIVATQEQTVDKNVAPKAETPVGVYTTNGLSPAALALMSSSNEGYAAEQKQTQIRQIADLTKDLASAVADKNFVISGPYANTFQTSSKVLIPKAAEAVRRALASVGNAVNVCSDKECKNLCDHVVGDIWGYTFASGYETANSHWETAVRNGLAHQGSKDIPVGALMFWQLKNPAGHVAVYVGNGLVVGSLTASDGTSNIYLAPADMFSENSNNRYLGWAYPVFFGESQGAAL